MPRGWKFINCDGCGRDTTAPMRSTTGGLCDDCFGDANRMPDPSPLDDEDADDPTIGGEYHGDTDRDDL